MKTAFNLLPVLSFLIILFLLLFTTGCSPDYIPPNKKEANMPPNSYGYEWVEIRKGDTYPVKKKIRAFVNKDNLLSFSFKPDSSMITDLGTIDQLDWNKFIGLEYANGNAIVSAWRWNVKIEMLELSLYLHKHGKILHSEQNIPVKLDITTAYLITIGIASDDSTFIKINNEYLGEKMYKREKIKPTQFGRYRFDMFGGTVDETGKASKAPHKIKYLKNSAV